MSQTIVSAFAFGMNIGETVHRDFEIREPLVQDMVEAEKEVPPTDLHAFNVQLLCQVTVRVGTFTGPFSPAMFMRLKRHDYNAMVQAMMEADKLGKPEQSAVPTTLTRSSS